MGGNGCVATSLPAEIDVTNAPDIYVDGYTTICDGETTSLSIANSTGIQWSTGGTTASINISPMTATQYSVSANSQGCSFTDSVTIDVISAVPPAMPTNLIPSDSTLSLAIPVTFSWQPATNATHYDLYYWKENVSQPPLANLRDVQLISNEVSNLNYSTGYKWQVVAKNSCFETPAPELYFTTKGLPDLIVSEMDVQPDAIAGTSVEVAWTVKNVGDESTGSTAWIDYVYLSTDLDLRIGDDLLLGSFNNINFLPVGESYTQTQSFLIPQTLTGTFYLFVITDHRDAYCLGSCALRYAHGGFKMKEKDEQNNFHYQTLAIYPGPSPDLSVLSVGAPIAAFGGDQINVTYSVNNEGESHVENTTWRDAVYISKFPTFNESEAILVGQKTITEDIEVDSTQSKTITANLPLDAFGVYYIFIKTDSDETVFENFRETNNVLAAADSINVTLTPPADLLPVSLNVPASIQSGNFTTVDWAVANQGFNAPFISVWEDAIYLSDKATFDVDSAIFIGKKLRFLGDTLDLGEQYTNSLYLKIPDGLDGNYYAYIYTDYRKKVFEYNMEGNNVLRSAQPISIILPPLPDLVITDITVPDTIYSQGSFEVSWTVENSGTAPAKSAWVDRVYISGSPIWDENGASLLVEKYHNSDLGTGQNYTEGATVSLPLNYNHFTNYFHVITDHTDQVFENNMEANNRDVHINHAAPATILIQLNSDLAIHTFNAPDTLSTGEMFQVDWTVKNVGDTKTNYNYWVDQAVLSPDTLFSVYGDHNIASYYLNNGLEVDAQYGRSSSSSVPHGIEGNWYILLLTDRSNKVGNDVARQNNKVIHPVHISLSPSPNLTAETLEGPNNATAGQEVPINYAVKNTGVVSTGGQMWIDAVYLSNSTDLSGDQNIWLKDIQRMEAQEVDSTYFDTLSVEIPNYVDGNYYLVVKADRGENIYEHLGENDNTLAIPFLVTPQQISDLVFTSSLNIGNQLLGDTLGVDFTVKNIGANTAIGKLRTAVNFSMDTVFNSTDDPLFSFIDQNIMLVSGDSISGTIESVVKDIDPGDYTGIKRTNTRSLILESDQQNNTVLTDNPFNLDAELLPLDVLTSTPLEIGDLVYYKISVAAGLDLLITQTSNQTAGINEIYVAFEKVPSPTDFDVKHSNTGVAHQLLLPGTQAGDYYLFVKTQTDFTTPQAIDLLAQALPFSIINVSPNVVGKGQVTTTVNGAGYEATDSVYLVDGNGQSVATGLIVDFVSSMQMKVRWDFSSTPVGTYKLMVEKTGGVAVELVDAITVEVLRPFELEVVDLSPPSIRVGRTGLFTYEFYNNSNVDMDFVKGEFLMPAGIKVTEIETQGKVLLREDIFVEDTTITNCIEYGGATHLPVTAKNLGAGESFIISFAVSEFAAGNFPLSGKFLPFTGSEFIEMTLSTAENTRQEILQDPVAFGADSAPDFLDLLTKPDLYRDSIVNAMISIGLIKALDTIGFAANCSSCIDFTYDTQNGIGQSTYSSFEMGAKESLLWEISHPNGTASNERGWDFYQINGPLTVTAQPSIPFTIYVNSVSLSDGNPSFLSSFSPGYDICWPFMIATGGIIGFEISKFNISTNFFEQNNNLYGGGFSIVQSGDTLFICFNAAIPGAGQQGFPGNSGGIGEPGGIGGAGGNGTASIPPSEGGVGGAGGPGTGDLPPGNGGEGGPGGNGNGSQPGGPGGNGGPGGPGGPGQSGGSGGTGGIGGSGSGGSGASGNSGGSGSPGPDPNGSNGNNSSGICELIRPAQEILCDVLLPNAGCGSSGYGCGKPIFKPKDAIKCVVGAVGCFSSPVPDLKALSTAANAIGCVAFRDPLSCASSVICDIIPALFSCDPNEIHGPPGFGDERWVSDQETLPYTIYFENDPEFASAAAQKVIVRQPLDSLVDPLTFRLGDFGFGPYTFEVPEDQISYTTTIDLPDSTGIDLEVTAGLDIVSRSAFWILQSINPATGLAPDDPEAGFLPVNDTLTGTGEGFVKYTIKPIKDQTTGSVIEAQAEIFFDINPSIETNIAFNTVDSGEPESEVATANILPDGVTIELTFSGNDDTGGSGLATYDILMSENGEPFVEIVADLDSNLYSFTGQVGSYYAFYSMATDNVGNKEANPAMPDLLLNMGTIPICNVPLEYVLDVDTIPGGVLYAFDFIELENGLVLPGDSLTVTAGQYIHFDNGFEAQLGSYLYALIGDCNQVPNVPLFSQVNPAALAEEVAEQYLSNVQFRVYTNPISKQTGIEYYLPATSNVHLYLTDVSGKIVKVFEDGASKNKGLSRFFIKETDLEQGVYFIVFQSAEKQLSEKLIISY